MKDKLSQPISIVFTVGTVIKTLVILFLAYLAYLIRDTLLIILTAVVIASAVEPLTQWMIRRGIPRVVSVITIYLTILVTVASTLAFILPPLFHDIRSIISTVPEIVENVDPTGFEAIPGLSGLFDSFAASVTSGELFGPAGAAEGQVTFGFFQTAGTVFGGLFSFLLIIVISFYLAAQNDGVASFLRVVTPYEHEKYIIGLWKRSQRKIGLWMQGQLLLGVIVGVLTYLGLSILGVNNALLLALIAASFELIPLFGPILAAIPAIGIAVLQDGLTLGLIVLGLYLIIQQFENHLIHPLVVKKIVGIPSLLAILALIIGAQLAGFLGMIIAVPVAAALMEFLSDVEKDKMRKIEESQTK